MAIVSPTFLEFEVNGNFLFSYTVVGAALPQATTVELFWSSSATLAGRIGAAIDIMVIPAQTAPGTYGPFTISANALGPVPQAANHILVVTDPNNVLGNFNAAINVQTLPAGIASFGANLIATLVPTPSTGLPLVPAGTVPTNGGSGAPAVGASATLRAGDSLPVAGGTATLPLTFSEINGGGMGENVNEIVVRILNERIAQGDYFADALTPIVKQIGPFIAKAIADGKSTDQVVSEIRYVYPVLDERSVRDLLLRIEQKVGPNQPASSQSSQPPLSFLPPDLREPSLAGIDQPFISDWVDGTFWLDGLMPTSAAQVLLATEANSEPQIDWTWALLAGVLGPPILAEQYWEEDS
jgi:hypothetical protein